MLSRPQVETWRQDAPKSPVSVEQTAVLSKALRRWLHGSVTFCISWSTRTASHWTEDNFSNRVCSSNTYPSFTQLKKWKIS